MAQLFSLGVLAHVMDKLIVFIKNVSGKELLFYLFLVAGGACPGLLAIWKFSPDMIDACTTPKLIALSVAITLPLISINTILTIYAVFLSHEDKGLADIAPVCVAFGSGVSMVVIALPVFLCFMFSWSINTFLWLGLGVESVFSAFAVLLGLVFYTRYTNANRAP